MINLSNYSTSYSSDCFYEKVDYMDHQCKAKRCKFSDSSGEIYYLNEKCYGPGLSFSNRAIDLVFAFGYNSCNSGTVVFPTSSLDKCSPTNFYCYTSCGLGGSPRSCSNTRSCNGTSFPDRGETYSALVRSSTYGCYCNRT